MRGMQEGNETRTEDILHARSPKLWPCLFEHCEHATRHKGSRKASRAVERVKGQGIGSVRRIKVDRLGHTMCWDEIQQRFHEIPVRINDHEPASRLHIRINQVNEERGLTGTRFAEHPHMSQA